MRNEPDGKTENPTRKDDNSLITPAEAAAMLRLSPRTLEKMRQRGEGPTYFKIQGRIWYTREKVLSHIATTVRRSTCDPPLRSRAGRPAEARQETGEPCAPDQSPNLNGA